MSGKVFIGQDVSDGWETSATGIYENGVLTIHVITRRYHGEAIDAMSPADFKRLYLCEFPPPPKVGDGAIWNGRNVIIREIEPNGERDRAIVQDFETGRERHVYLSRLGALEGKK
jgi:exopolysaccharide biosynthesis predicted pyruvyltransferase EpsI